MKLFATIALALLSNAVEKSPKEIWLDWKKEESNHHRTTACSPFSIEDGYTLSKGETVSLVKKDEIHLFQSPAPKEIALLQATFDGNEIRLSGVTGKRPVNLVKAKEWKSPTGLYLRGRITKEKKGRITVFNPKNKKVENFKLQYFPFLKEGVVKARFARKESPEPVVFSTSRGSTQNYQWIGTATFEWKKKLYLIEIYSSDPTKLDVFIPYKDQTNGKSTYGAGRYVNAAFTSANAEELLIDFNQSYNPYCAYSHFYDCPLVRDNHLPFALEAGEKYPPSYY